MNIYAQTPYASYMALDIVLPANANTRSIDDVIHGIPGISHMQLNSSVLTSKQLKARIYMYTS